MSHQSCPHCAQPLPTPLVWKTLFAGQTAHTCPACRKRFRLTYAAKRAIAYLNVALMLGITILIGYALYGEPTKLLRYILYYLIVAIAILIALPQLARYEKTSAPYR
ncbi:MAG: hypothetical protein JSW09_04280 [Pseudomonadota bacterium]|nr:MAG: hypothetical protein JSW09_04280 [Pseudomonadota bacterium]